MAKMLASISALLLSVAFLVFGHGLQSTLLPLAANKADFSELAIGIVSSGYYVGMVLGCLGAPHVIMRAGHIRALAALVSLMSASAILHPVFVDPVAWFLIRVVSGFCLAGFYTIVESWLHETATNETRGTVMSIYIVVLFASMMIGQVSIAGMEITSFVPFAAASVAVSLAVMPVCLTTANQPAPITLVRFRPTKLYKTSPAALVGTLLIGVANGAMWSLSPLYGSEIGLTTNQAAVYAASIIAGGMISQWPIGRLSDKMDRRVVLIALSVISAVIAVVIAVLPTSSFATALMLAMVIGVFSQPTYSVAVSHAFDHAAPEDFVETSSGLLMAFGLGSVAGPISASLLMLMSGPAGLYLLVAIVYSVMGAFILTRVFARSALDPEDKTDFEFAATAQVGAVVSPEPLDIEAANVIAPEEFPAYDDLAHSQETDTITEEVVGPDQGANSEDETDKAASVVPEGLG